MDSSLESFLFLTTLTLICAASGAVAWACAGPWAGFATALGWAFGAISFAVFGADRRLSFEGPAPYDAFAAVAAERAELEHAVAAPARASKPIRL